MLTTHRIVAFLVLAATWGAAVLAGIAYYRRREPRGLVTHMLALAQTLLVAQVGVGLLLLCDHHRAPHRLHYLYGTLALLARRAPRPAGLVCGGYSGGRSARGAGVHDWSLMKSGFFSRMNPTLRGFLIIALIAAVVVVLQLQATLVALLLIARILFVLAIAFFVYLMWRERREEIGAWPLRARIVFYGAAVLAVADLGLNWYGGAHGPQVLAFVAVLGGCGFAMWRTWRDQRPRARPAPTPRRARLALLGLSRAGRRRSACRARCTPMPRCRGGAASGA